MSNIPEKYEALLKSDLQEGESILWTGRPKGIKLMEAPNGTPIIIRWAACLVLAACAIWYGMLYAPAAGISDGSTITILALLFLGFFALRPVMDISTIQRKCIYCVTDRRAIVCLVGTSLKSKSKSLREGAEVSVDMIADNRGNIYFGQKQERSFQKSRSDCLTFPNNPEEEGFLKRPLIFYSVENPQEIIKLFPALEQ